MTSWDGGGARLLVAPSAGEWWPISCTYYLLFSICVNFNYCTLSFYLLLYILSFYLFYPITHDICIYIDILNVNKTFIIMLMDPEIIGWIALQFGITRGRLRGGDGGGNLPPPPLVKKKSKNFPWTSVERPCAPPSFQKFLDTPLISKFLGTTIFFNDI